MGFFLRENKAKIKRDRPFGLSQPWSPQSLHNLTRADPNARLSVDYMTRNGTAQAGSDYLATSGRLVIYPMTIKPRPSQGGGVFHA